MDKPDIAALAERIAEKRRHEGLSLRDAGRAAGVAFSTLGRIEQGATPSYGVGQRIEAWLRGEAPVLPPPPMTLRDWFAGQYVSGIHSGGATFRDAENVAEEAYSVADAMLALRHPPASTGEIG